MTMCWQKRRGKNRIKGKGGRLFPISSSLSERGTVQGHTLQFIAAVLVHNVGLPSIKFHLLIISINLNRKCLQGLKTQGTLSLLGINSDEQAPANQQGK